LCKEQILKAVEKFERRSDRMACIPPFQRFLLKMKSPDLTGKTIIHD
jgi:hypothetical protein